MIGYMIPMGTRGDLSNQWMGYQIGRSKESASVTAIGKESFHSSFPIHSLIRAAVINDDETVNYYLDPTNFDKKTDGTASKLDGTDGQVMIFKPKYYKKVEIDGDLVSRKFSLYPLDGYEASQAYWIGQQPGHIDANGKLCSIHGVRATTNKNLDEFRTAARARGSNNWCQNNYEVWEAINDLFRLKYLTRSSQASTTLGAGATNANGADWSNYNGYLPIVDCGLKTSLNDTEVSFTVEKFRENKTLPLVSQAACFMGIEHVFGHLWQWMDGCNPYFSTADGAKVYICTDPSKFASDTSTNYTHLTEGENINISNTSGYISKMLNGGILPLQTSGYSYYNDYYNTPLDTNVGWRGCFVGGNLNNGTNAGLSCLNLNNPSSNRNANNGSHICLYKILNVYIYLATWQKIRAN